MKARTLSVLALSLVLSACASPQYQTYANAHTLRTQAHEKRLESIAQIARESNDPATKVAAILTLGSASKQEDAIAPPVNPLVELAETGLKAYSTWASTVFNVLQLGRGTTSVSDDSIANGLKVLTPTLGK